MTFEKQELFVILYKYCNIPPKMHLHLMHINVKVLLQVIILYPVQYPFYMSLHHHFLFI